MSLLIFFQNRFTEQTGSLTLFMSAYDVKNGSVDLFIQCGERGELVSGCDLFLKAQGLGRKRFEGAITRQKQGQTLSGSSRVNSIAEHIRDKSLVTTSADGVSGIGRTDTVEISKTVRDDAVISREG